MRTLTDDEVTGHVGGIASHDGRMVVGRQENQQLRIQREVAAGFSDRLQRLCGQGARLVLVGHIDADDLIERLGEGGGLDTVWFAAANDDDASRGAG